MRHTSERGTERKALGGESCSLYSPHEQYGRVMDVHSPAFSIYKVNDAILLTVLSLQIWMIYTLGPVPGGRTSFYSLRPESHRRVSRCRQAIGVSVYVPSCFHYSTIGHSYLSS